MVAEKTAKNLTLGVQFFCHTLYSLAMCILSNHPVFHLQTFLGQHAISGCFASNTLIIGQVGPDSPMV